MGDQINQNNIFGANMVNSTKKIFIKIATPRTQGFIAGIVTSIISSYIYDLIKPLL